MISQLNLTLCLESRIATKVNIKSARKKPNEKEGYNNIDKKATIKKKEYIIEST